MFHSNDVFCFIARPSLYPVMFLSSVPAESLPQPTVKPVVFNGDQSEG